MSERYDYRRDLRVWFGLTRASFLTLPRVLMEAMPEEWQARMAELLFEYEVAFPNQPGIGTRVQVTDANGRLIATPEWLTNYRHPERATIDKLRRGETP